MTTYRPIGKDPIMDMKRLEVGLTGSVTWKVKKEHCISRGGQFWVFSTPSMMLLMEHAAANLLIPFLGAGQSSVGTVVLLKHLAPTPLGQEVRADVTITAIDRRRVSFKAKIFDEMEQVGEGEHERFIIDIAKYDERLKEKAIL